MKSIRDMAVFLMLAILLSVSSFAWIIPKRNNKLLEDIEHRMDAIQERQQERTEQIDDIKREIAEIKK